MRDWLKNAVAELNAVKGAAWSTRFVHLRMEFARLFVIPARFSSDIGSVLSTEHGAELFSTLLRHLRGEPYVDQDGKHGQDKNYASLLRIHRVDSPCRTQPNRIE